MYSDDEDRFGGGRDVTPSPSPPPRDRGRGGRDDDRGRGGRENDRRGGRDDDRGRGRNDRDRSRSRDRRDRSRGRRDDDRDRGRGRRDDDRDRGRGRDDDSDDDRGKKGKGKGSKGCFNCGGDHLARDCPEGGKGKGNDRMGDDEKGKGKGSFGRKSNRSLGREIPKLYSIHKGTVVRVADFGCFVRIGDGDRYKDGLLHISRLSASGRVENVSDMLSQDDPVWVKVCSVGGEDSDKYSLDMRFVKQSTGEDLDPNNVQADAGSGKGKGKAPEPIRIGAVQDTVCSRCGSKGHFAKECWAGISKKYDLIEEPPEEPDEAPAKTEGGHDPKVVKEALKHYFEQQKQAGSGSSSSSSSSDKKKKKKKKDKKKKKKEKKKEKKEKKKEKKEKKAKEK
eukprot:TRINITY_DN5268_c0_g1_i9.p1 TRINITY_DN5268_c0_g1~~TRINITY_DN5268_c0_g1_i9.p1  ORF type:complete len:394 (+),score=101.19 TRINITY_DN5268_c0_g1_i9:120-1301(+)